ncbi:CDP-alcohol phosphatidyltransferase family protein [Marinimicrobium sp. ABcell2]|uniref:CDP-alcohol phosphatidyltransferase family protein n=1 Tax=Marinimicrobium sp. ABcell2 TaxID=3069751 RepID=UPI0027B735DC|nr:CDP-alcohol phosphatidyltransferase family protein [Marinimicrobium sp. ABcell2]MDQ2077798.1 CDP-alcohol phosphatidyltransferase family protein [Marinimicrobium sp. ABcell2]
MTDTSPNDLPQRRPIAARDTGWANRIASWLASRDVTPNQISVASVVFAGVAGALLLARLQLPDGWAAAALVLAAVCIQGRLLCNLFDGMVAVEGGKTTPAGEMFNDIPDRIADPLILIGAGYAAAAMGYAPLLGWLAALLAVLTAYIRVLGVSLDAPADFGGPMAKQHRMALITVACVLSLAEFWVLPAGSVLTAALVLVVFGAALTVWRRTRTLYRFLNARATEG